MISFQNDPDRALFLFECLTQCCRNGFSVALCFFCLSSSLHFRRVNTAFSDSQTETFGGKTPTKLET